MSSPTNQPVSNAPDSRESRNRGPAVPIWIIVAMVMLLYWGGIYFDTHSGWFNAKIYEPYENLVQIQALQPSSGGSEMFELGKAVYNRPTCAACHQATGLGTPGQFPPLVGSEFVNEEKPGRMIRIVLNGLGGPLTVKDVVYNNNMVPWNMLSDEEIAAVITYVRQNKEWGNKASAVTPAQVKAVREKIKGHPGPFTADELMKISPDE